MDRRKEIATYTLIQQDRSSAVEVLYQRYGKKLYSYAVTSWHLSEDESWEIVYETLYRTVEKFDNYTFESEKKFSSFIFTIFCNNLRRQYRDAKKMAEKLQFSPFNESLFEESHSNPGLFTERQVQHKLSDAAVNAFREEASVNSELMDMLELCLDELQDWERILLLLRSQNMPYSDIAEYMNKPADQLKVYYQRTRNKLAQLLEVKLSSVKP
jgi:RNA polymerase sigma-70 factor (ECF subfamily)